MIQSERENGLFHSFSATPFVLSRSSSPALSLPSSPQLIHTPPHTLTLRHQRREPADVASMRPDAWKQRRSAEAQRRKATKGGAQEQEEQKTAKPTRGGAREQAQTGVKTAKGRPTGGGPGPAGGPAGVPTAAQTTASLGGASAGKEEQSYGRGSGRGRGRRGGAGGRAHRGKHAATYICLSRIKNGYRLST